MARIFMTGFEAGNLDVLLAHDAAINTTTVRTGAYSVAIAGVGKGIYHDIPGDPAEIFLRAGVYYAGGTSAATRKLLLFDDSAGGAQFALYIDTATHYLKAYRGDASTLLDTSSTAVPRNVWTCLEARIKIDNADGIVTVKLDGIEVMDFAGDTQATANADLGEARWGSDGASEWTGYLDDLAVNDTTGDENNGWIGRGGIYGLFPSGAGTHTDFTPNTGANYAAVDEVPPDDDTTYVQYSTAGGQDSYVMADLPDGVGIVSAVQWVGRARLSTAGDSTFKRLIHYNETDYTGTALAVDVTYAYKQEIFDTDPTGTAWTVASVNAIEAGMEIS